MAWPRHPHSVPPWQCLPPIAHVSLSMKFSFTLRLCFSVDCNQHTTHAADRDASGALSISLCLPLPNVQAERIGPIPGIGANFSFLRFMVHLHFVILHFVCRA